MSKSLPILTAALLAASSAFAQDPPYEQSIGLNDFQNQGAARLIWYAQQHPQVAVSRSLAAQPVHPHMAKVQIGGTTSQTDGGTSNGAITTWIDPLRRLDGNHGLAESHSFVKAQRLHRSLSGTTTEQLAALYNASLAARPTAAGPNQARVIVPPQAGRFKPIDQVNVRPVLILPAPNAAPTPRSAPAPADQKLLADRTD